MLKQKGSLLLNETSIHNIIFVTLTENTSVVKNDTKGPQKYPHAQHGTRTIPVFWIADGEASELLLPS